MSMTMGGLLIFLFALLLISFTNSLPLEFEAKENRIPVKRFNFNLLRTWQPLARGEPFEDSSRFSSTSNADSEPEEKKPLALKQRRIRQKLMCIAALQSTRACSDLDS
ncbi:hypothetical protein FO519_003261 [Halicephalobus sp. NKZ332]|nr:hypothetical protein FO519_003261 [Halicephalobus sp. NKZ332]